ncbi:hypothetical protein E2C01_051042 [Portunus trituberculatus]|uniref:Uncharacterized protein n=1 Tax=Portunus trituberculatus TaxID=210409 RepID=A0A5B7G9X7_PORTR|nr:hypothetical protein [Portunus trituberculatus]
MSERSHVHHLIHYAITKFFNIDLSIGSQEGQGNKTSQHNKDVGGDNRLVSKGKGKGFNHLQLR